MMAKKKKESANPANTKKKSEVEVVV